jgi:hypothetical protein
MKQLRSILLSDFLIESSHYGGVRAKGQYVIRIPKREVPKVHHLVEAHIPASMRHVSGYNNGGRIHPLISPLSSLYLVPLVE